MQNFRAGCLLLMTFSCLVYSQDESVDYDPEEFAPFNGQRFDLFDWQLCSAVSERDHGNIIISPISVKLVLAMLYEGSTGQTAKELEKVLQLPPSKSATRIQLSAILRSLQTKNPNYELEIGSKVYVDYKLQPKNWFQRILYLYYNAYVERTNFTDYKSAADKINSWVESITHGKIRKLVSQAETLDQTMMLLINAVYFKGKWKTPFLEAETYPGKFKTPHGYQNVEYMTQSSYYYYSRSPELNSRILRLPYLGQKFAMYIILPENPDGLDQLLKNLNPFVVRKHVWQLEEINVEVTLPKFKIEYKSDLKEILRQMGIKNIFENFGDMKGIARNKRSKNLVVSNVVQKASIEVTEEGSIAAAATEVQLVNKFGGFEESFNASHPFLFYIEDESTGTVVFVGKLVHPENEPDNQVVQPEKPPPIVESAPEKMQMQIPLLTRSNLDLSRLFSMKIRGQKQDNMLYWT